MVNSNDVFPVKDGSFPQASNAGQVVHINQQSYERASDKEEADDEIDLRELFAVLRRRKGTILLIALLVFLAAFLMTMMITPTYRASVTLQIEMDSTKVLNYDVDTTGSQSTLNSKDFYQTQYEILKSTTLAGKTIDQLNLRQSYTSEEVGDVQPFFVEPIAAIKEMIFGVPEEGSTEFEALAQLSDEPAEEEFLENLSITPVKNSQIVKVNFDSEDPGLAATVANALADNYIKMNLERRVDAASYAEDFLTEELVLSKSRLEESEAKLVGYAKEASIFQTNDERSQSLTAQKLTAINIALTEAESDRIAAQSRYVQAQRSLGVSKVLDNSTVQELKKSVVRLESSYQEKLQVYKPGYPLMVQLKRQINEFKLQITNETNRITAAVEGDLKSDYLAAQEREQKLRSELEVQKQGLLVLRDKSIGYNTLLREVETNRSLYEGLLQRIKEVGVAGGVGANNVSVLDPAIVPYKKNKPNTKMNLALGGVFGVFLGMVVAFLLEFLDDRVKSTEELERILSLPLLGVTPALKGSDPATHSLITMEQPTSAMAEAFRSLRTNLLFASREGTPKVLAITSAMPAEGKSSTCLNLATAFGQSNKRVLLIDADLRKPSIHKRLKLDNSVGLSNVLTGQETAETAIQKSMIEGVSVITAGPLSPNPAELLSSERFQDLFDLVPDTFDMIILDCPPVMGLADALILSNRATATVVVSAFSQSRKRASHDANRRLRQAHANLIGFIFTKVKAGGGYGYSYEYQYYYSYGTDRLSNNSD